MKTAVEMPSANVIEAVQVVGNKGSFSELTIGSHMKISVKAGEKFRLKKAGADSIADDVIALKEGDTLSLQYADGTQISLEGFYTSQGAEIELSLDEGASHTIASTDAGTTLSDGSILVYSHGNTTTLMGMVSQNETLQTALANNSSLAHLDRYAEVATGVATDAVAGSSAAGTAATTATTDGFFSGMSTGAMVGLGALGVGVIALAAGGGGGDGGSAPAAPADTTAPVLTGVLAHGVSRTVVLTYGETLDASHPPLSTSFTITTGGVANVVTAVAVSGATVTLTLTSAFSAGDAVVISYNGSGVNAIQDASGNDAVAIASLSSGAVADGYVRGAQIWIDTNHDGVQDYNTGITTDESGNFFLPPGTPSGSIVAIGGVNIDTGVENTMPLRAPEGSTVINPLTTLVQAIIQANPSTSIADASTSVVTALGLTAGTNLTTYDPIEAAQSSDPTVAANALVAQQAAATVATIITLAAESAADSTAATTATNTIISNIVTQIQASETSTVVLDLGDSTTISNMTEGVTLSVEVQSAIADASTAIQAATVLSEITTAQSVALDTIAVGVSTITATAITADTTPAIKINLNVTSTDGTAAVTGDTVLLKADGVQIASATLSDTDIARGYITINSPVLSEGAHAMSAVIVDQAGNISAPYPSVSVTIDTTPTTASTINRVATDDIINLAEKTAGVTLSGTIASGSTVTVEGNAATVTGTSWSYTLTAGDYTAMGEGAETIDVRVTAANATFADSTRDITIDTIAPLTPTISAVSTDNAINTAEKNSNVVISGTAEANALITLTLGAGNIHAVNADGSGAWTYALTAADYTSIGTGTTITATAKDTAGNVSTAVSQVITVDTGAPLLTVNSVATDNIINISEKAATVTVTGVNETGATVTVNGASATVTGTTWSYVLDTATIGTMGEGSETLTIVTTDAAGNATTRTKTINVDTIIATPTAVLTTDSGTSATDDITNNAALTFNTAAADVTRSFVVDGGSASGTYTAPMTDGSHTVVVTDTDTAGNTATVTKTFTLDTAAPTVSSGATASVGENTTATIYTATSAETSIYTLGGTDAALFNIDSATGAVTFKIAPDFEAPAGGNSDNIYDITVTATDMAGNASSAQAVAITVNNVDVTINTVATANIINAAAKTAGVTLTGNNEPNATVTVNGATATVNGTAWSYILDTAAIAALGADGAKTLTVVSGGQTINHSITLDTTAPTITMNPATADNILNAVENSNPTKTVTGTTTAEDGQTVTYKVDGITKGTGVVSGGAWTVTFAAEAPFLSDGTHVRSAEVADLAGNIATVSSNFTVDAAAPTITISAITADNTLNAAEIAAGGAITGTTTAEDGRTVTVKVDGFTVGTAIVSGGTWSVSVASITMGALAQGSHSITADVSDTAGNPAIQATHAFNVDKISITPTITGITPDTGTSSSDVITNNGTGTLNGTAEANSTVAITVNGVLMSTVTANGSGVWSMPYSGLSAGSYTAVVTATDALGNVSAPFTGTMTVDTVASALGYTLSNGTATISNLEAGASWEYQIDGGAFTAGTGSTFAVPTSGAHTFAMRQTDIAGNISTLSSGTSVDGGNTPPNNNPYTMINNNTLLIAKGQALNIDLQNYVGDPDGDTVTITVTSSTLPAGLSISNGIITGTTTATTGSLNITLDDGQGGISTQTINLYAIDDPSSMAYVYGSAATIDLVSLTASGAPGSFYTVNSNDGGINLSVIDTDGSSWSDYQYDTTSFQYVNQDTGTFTASAITATSFTASGAWGTENIVLTDMKAVNSINGILTSGLYQATATFTTTAAASVGTTTDWWESSYSYWDQTTNSSVTATTLATLRDVLIDPNWGGDVWISDDLRVKLVGDAGATSGYIVAMVWDGTYNMWTDQNGISQINKHLIATDTVVGGWTLDNTFLTVTGTGVGVTAFKEDSINNVLLQTEISAVNSVRTETWFSGPSLIDFQEIVMSVMSGMTGLDATSLEINNVYLGTMDAGSNTVVDGHAGANSEITVSVNGNTYTNTSDSYGYWQVEVPFSVYTNSQLVTAVSAGNPSDVDSITVNTNKSSTFTVFDTLQLQEGSVSYINTYNYYDDANPDIDSADFVTIDRTDALGGQAVSEMHAHIVGAPDTELGYAFLVDTILDQDYNSDGSLGGKEELVFDDSGYIDTFTQFGPDGSLGGKETYDHVAGVKTIVEYSTDQYGAPSTSTSTEVLQNYIFKANTSNIGSVHVAEPILYLTQDLSYIGIISYNNNAVNSISINSSFVETRGVSHLLDELGHFEISNEFLYASKSDLNQMIIQGDNGGVDTFNTSGWSNAGFTVTDTTTGNAYAAYSSDAALSNTLIYVQANLVL